MGTVINEGAEPVNEAERAMVRLFRDRAPADWLILHNRELRLGNRAVEIDIVLITDRSIVLIDVKSGRGPIRVEGSMWRFPGRRGKEYSPARKIREHAKKLHSQLLGANERLDRVKVDGLVLFSVPGVDVRDPQNIDAPDVLDADTVLAALTGGGRPGIDKVMEYYRHLVLDTFNVVLPMSTGRKEIADYEVVAELGAFGDTREYRVRNAAGRVELLRAYAYDHLLDEARRTAEIKVAQNAYDILHRLDHPRVVRHLGFHPVPGESEYFMVLKDVGGGTLTRWLEANPPRGREMGVGLSLIRDIVEGLEHVHAEGVIHRALSPEAVLVTDDEHAVLSGFDYAKPPGNREHTVVNRIGEAVDPAYVAPECRGRLDRLSPAADVYAAGIVACEVLFGERPEAGAFPDRWRKEAVRRGVPLSMIEQMVAAAPQDRPTAARALATLTAEAETDYAALPSGHMLNQRFELGERLSAPDASSAVYRAYDMEMGGSLVVKLTLRDLDEAKERMLNECAVLRRLNDSRAEHAVRAEELHFLPNGRPFLTLRYLEGSSLDRLHGRDWLDPHEVPAIALDAVRALISLHDLGVYHRDIKPSNLLWSPPRCHLLDFGAAVDTTAAPSHAEDAGTPRYLPPDLVLDGSVEVTALADRDLYGLALSLYETLTNTYPWDTDTPPLGEPPRTPHVAPEHAAFAAVLCRQLAPHRRDRYQDAKAFLRALEDSLAPAHTADSDPHRPKLLVADDQMCAKIRSELADDYDCVTVGSMEDWNLRRARLLSTPFAGAFIDLHMEGKDDNRGMEIISRLMPTRVPVTLITSGTRNLWAEQDEDLSRRHRLLGILRKVDDKAQNTDWWAALRRQAEIMTATEGEPVQRRFDHWLRALRYHVELGHGDDLRGYGDAPADSAWRRFHEGRTEIGALLDAGDVAAATELFFALWEEYAE